MSAIRKIIFILISRYYRFFEKYLGLHVTFPHFYSPLPKLLDLSDKDYSRIYSCKGLDFNDEYQHNLIKEEFLKYKEEFQPEKNIGLSLVDAFVLYAMIRLKKPSIMVEIGSGHSTRIALKALTKNREEGFDFSFTAIEPYPPSFLNEIKIPGFKLLVKKVENVPLDFFSDIDLLFIDSSHVSKIGSDVNFEILEIVPHLKKGSLIHWHDIMFPQEYPRQWIESGQQFWNESYMLQSFLAFNSSFKIKWASKYLQTTADDLLRESFSYYQSNHNLSSLWIERVS